MKAKDAQENKKAIASDKLDGQSNGTTMLSTLSETAQTALTIARKIGIKNLLKIGGGTVGVAVVATVLFPVLGALMIFGLGAGCMVVLGASVYGYNALKRNGLINPISDAVKNTLANVTEATVVDATATPASRDFKLWDTRNIYVFASEPSVSQIIQARNTTQQEDQDLFAVEPGTMVSLISDVADKQAVKVRITTGKHQGKVGWVCRSLLIKEEAAA